MRALAAIACMSMACEPRVTRLPPPRDPEKVTFVASSEVRGVAVGWNDICVLMSTGDVRCKQDFREAGARRLGSFITVRGARAIEQIAAGHHHACARNAEGSVLCWGRNDSGETSGGDVLVRAARSVPLPGRAVEVAVGDTQSCARLATGAVLCWGVVASVRNAPPTPIDWFSGATALGLSTDAVCAVVGAALRCSFAGGKPLSPVEGLVDQIALGRYRGCALLKDMTVSCFSLSRPSSAPTTEKVPAWAEAVEGLTDVAQLVAGTAHFCARKRDGRVVCWGSNHYGQLGNGSRDASKDPVEVKHLNDALTLAAGGDRTCAYRAAQKVVCWGADLLADAMFRALTGLMVDPGPPGPNDSLVPEELRVPVEYEK